MPIIDRNKKLVTQQINQRVILPLILPRANMNIVSYELLRQRVSYKITVNTIIILYMVRERLPNNEPY